MDDTYVHVRIYGMYVKGLALSVDINCTHNEGTKVHNPRRLYHVHDVAPVCMRIHCNIRMHMVLIIYICGQMCECTGKYTDKDKSSDMSEKYL